MLFLFFFIHQHLLLNKILGCCFFYGGQHTKIVYSVYMMNQRGSLVTVNKIKPTFP